MADGPRDYTSSSYSYCPEGDLDFRWLGYYIGKNTYLRTLELRSNPLNQLNSSVVIESFFRGVNGNRSIQTISFYQMDLLGGEIFQSLRPFFENNNSIFEIDMQECEFDTGSARQFSLALRCCNKSLKSVIIAENGLGDEQLLDIITALSAHPQLANLNFSGMNVGRNECTALAALLSSSATGLHSLSLNGNDIDDEGLDALVGGLVTNSRLSQLYLSHNHSITARGCQSLAVLLENNTSINLEELCLANINIDDEGARIFAHALASNRRLKTLYLGRNHGITAEAWTTFSKLLCDASSINNTYHSNHTLECLSWEEEQIPANVNALLAVNRNEDKTQVAIKKIIKYHQHFEMQPFFEWDLKVLPIAINWFERAGSIEGIDVAEVGKRKLETIYQFIHAMPEVFEPAPAGAGDKRKRSAFNNLI